MEEDRIIITGGLGFIGSALVRYLIDNTSYKVVNYDAIKYSANLDSLSSVSESERYDFIEGDICNKKLFSNTLEKFKPKGIIHLAAESHVDRSIDNADPFIQTNVFGTYNLLNCSLDYWNKLSKSQQKKFTFHHVSTDEVYGDIKQNEAPCNESRRYDPSSPYSASKASSDHLVRSWYRTYGLPVVVTNCSNNYGPFHFPEKLIPHIILNAIHGKKIPIYGDGKQIRDWIYVDDHVRGLMEVFDSGKKGDTYNIGGSNEIQNIDTAIKICSILDDLISKKPQGVHFFRDLICYVDDRPGHDRRYAIDSSKIQSTLNWRPKESFDTGLKKTVKWYLDNPQWWEAIFKKNYALKRLGKN